MPTTITALPTDRTDGRKRIHSLDILRGLVIVLMALDHVRDYFSATPFDPIDPAATEPAWFFTRWITHFCAPVFVFLAGTSAFLYGQKVQDKGKLSRFLLLRGLWLVLAELLIVTPSWVGAPPLMTGAFFLQVIWAIGVGMIALAGLIWLPRRFVLAIGLIIVAGHNALDGVNAEAWGSLGWLWQVLHSSFAIIPLGGEAFPDLLVAYAVLPWVGVMACGYGFGAVMEMKKPQRRTWLLGLGLGLIGLFLLLRGFNLYGDPAPWSVQNRGPLYSFLSFLNLTKYPPSLLYLCMTLGPAMLLLVPLERWESRVAEILRIFGRVPFFFYLIHLPLIHLLSRLFAWVAYGEPTNFFLAGVGMAPLPERYEPRLWLTYLAWALISLLMFFLCRWYNAYKNTHSYWWLSYV